MKKIIAFSILFATILFVTSGFANIISVSPEVIVKGKIDIQAPFVGQVNVFKFTSYDEDVYVYGRFGYKQSSGDLLIEVPKGEPGVFFLNYERHLDSGFEKQCVFTILAKSKNNVSINVRAAEGSFIECKLSGDQNNNTLSLTLGFKPQNKI